MYKRTIAISMTLLWVAALAWGTHAVWSYAARPGVAAVAAPQMWPRDDGLLTLDASRPTLVVFVHPRCPCTRATVSALAELVGKARGRLAARALVVKPGDAESGWERSPIVDATRAIPGVEVLVDEHGSLADRFDAATSGQVLLYGVDGRLLFRGGLTRGRGEVGDSDGARAVLELVAPAVVAVPGHTGRPASTAKVETPVYGCPLVTPGSPRSDHVVSEAQCTR